MKSKTRAFTPALILALAVGTSHLLAAPVITTATNTPAAGTATTSTTDETIYNSFVSTTDLLNGITGTGGTWNTGNGSSPAGLNDGSGAGDSNVTVPIGLTGAAWAANATASFREFFIGNGINGLGYNITEVQSIAAWQGASFQNQKYEILVSTVGSAAFTLLATVDFQPASGTSGSVQGGATKVNVTDSTGILATGIDAIRFNILDSSAATSGGSVIREIDVFGVPTPAVADTTPPTLNTLTSVTPADGATSVPVSSNLTATFSEPIALTGAGSITLRNQSGGADIPVALPGEVSIAGAVLTINPAASLMNLQQYAVEISSGTIRDLATVPNSFAGLLPTATPNWNFTAAPVDLAKPTVASLNPADNTTNVPLNANLVVTFDENVILGTGTITIKDLETPAQTVITLPDARVSVTGAVLTINPSSNLAASTDYAVRIASGAVTDLAGNSFTGITNDTTWNFTTAATPLRIMCLGDSITAGYTDNPTWANHPFMFGYRSGLYTRLTNAGYNFKFVGASGEPWNGAFPGDPTNGGTYTPALDLRTFAQDGHRGYGGVSIGTVNNNVAGYIAADTPDVILLLIGINGIGTGSPASLNTLVNTIVTAAPNARLIVAQITPRVSFNQSLYDYNLYIRDTLVPNYVTAGKKVSTVNLYSLFLTNPNDYSSAIAPNVLSNNINHPDNPRYDLMAQEWFKGIEALGLGSNTFSNWIVGFPGVGALTGFNDDPDGDGNKNGLEYFFGTSPSAFTTGVIPGARSGNTFTFTHPQNATPASDVSAAYRWSKDLATFNATGATDLNGTSVTFVATAGTPAPGITTVTATVTGTPAARLFLRVEVTKN